MIVRSERKIQSLDDELHLFEENEWDFMSVVDTRGSNYEYFNDIRDDDFEFKKFKPSEALAYVACACSILAVMIVITLKVTHNFDTSEYDALNNMPSIYTTGSVAYVEGGSDATPEELIGISNALNAYVSCLQNQNDYAPLDEYCVDSSKFAEKYYESTDAVSTIYDLNDCYARGLREFASLYRVHRINRVISKNGTYYCYVSVEYPSIYDVSEFVQMHSQSFVLKFQNGVVSEDIVSKFLLEVISENPVPSTKEDVCIQMKLDDGYFKLADDTFMLNICSDNYRVAVNQVLTSLGSLLTGNRE